MNDAMDQKTPPSTAFLWTFDEEDAATLPGGAAGTTNTHREAARWLVPVPLACAVRVCGGEAFLWTSLLSSASLRVPAVPVAWDMK